MLVKRVPVWLVVFSAAELGAIIVCAVFVGLWLAVLMWFWSGFLIAFIVLSECPIPARERVWIMIAWLPLLWYSGLQNG